MITRAKHKDEIENFARYEFKYLLDLNMRGAIEADVAQFMRYDGYVSEELDNQYMVRSLYFDTPRSENYYEKIDGVKNRHKYRLRTYADEFRQGLPIFLEEKGRHNERTYKHRIEVDFNELAMFLNPDRGFELLKCHPTSPFIEGFVFQVVRKRLAPVVLVDYLRRPYTSNYDINFRVTFDGDLRAKPSGHIFPDGREQWLSCDAGYTIMEVKFHRRIPAWFHRILQAQNLTRLSISKFCRGMEVADLAEDLS